MQYVSTRSLTESISSQEAIKSGIASDGGLFVPTNLPYLTSELLQRYKQMSYSEIALDILKTFLSDYDIQDLEHAIQSAYNKEIFDDEKITPILKLDDNLFIHELWHGPTSAFKDLALQILPNLLTAAMKKSNDAKKTAVLVATSGDTGKAALEGFKNVKDTVIIVFYPENGVSTVQKLQMQTQQGENVYVCGINGNFDDAQTGVKSIFADEDLRSQINNKGWSFSSANSINWGRLAPQIVYYVYSYVEMMKNGWIDPDEDFNIAVPTGNFGNILAAYYAKKMGVPIHRLICASNSNNVLSDFIKTGTYDIMRKFHTTISPSMDILISSNLERLLFDLANRDPIKINNMMKVLKETGSFKIDESSLRKFKSIFWGDWADEEETKQAIKETYSELGYLLDPHTAVAKLVLDKYRKETKDSRKSVVVSTASPFKFAEDVLFALTGEALIGDNDGFTAIKSLSELTGSSIPAQILSLKDKTILHTESCEIIELKKTVCKIFETL